MGISSAVFINAVLVELTVLLFWALISFVQWSTINGNERKRTNIIESPASSKVLNSALLMAGVWNFLEYAVYK